MSPEWFNHAAERTRDYHGPELTLKVAELFIALAATLSTQESDVRMLAGCWSFTSWQHLMVISGWVPTCASVDS